MLSNESLLPVIISNASFLNSDNTSGENFSKSFIIDCISGSSTSPAPTYFPASIFALKLSTCDLLISSTIVLYLLRPKFLIVLAFSSFCVAPHVAKVEASTKDDCMTINFLSTSLFRYSSVLSLNTSPSSFFAPDMLSISGPSTEAFCIAKAVKSSNVW